MSGLHLALAVAGALGAPAPLDTAPALWQPYHVTPRTGEQHLDLSRDWVLTHADRPVASVDEVPREDAVVVAEPTSVQVALFRAGRLPDPYVHLNSKQYEWVTEKAWYYRKSFRTPPAVAGSYAYLTFDGLDYFSRIWLNGRLLGRHEGMMGGPVLEVSELLRDGGDNQVVVEVLAGNWENPGFQAKSNPGRIIKPGNQANDAGGQNFFSVGMWRGARLDVVPRVHLERPFLVTGEISADRAVLRLSTEILAGTHSLEHDLHPWGNAILSRGPLATEVVPLADPPMLRVELTDEDGRTLRRDLPLDLIESRNWIEEAIEVPAPRLWWPNGMGEPHLYRVRLSLVRGGRETDAIEFDHGIRTIETRPTAGRRTSDRWDDWQFVVNGKPIFVKGINWMPADVLLDLPEERYRWLLEMARNGGIQMIRAWGGGPIETDEFYRLTDRLGIMVWQDFTVWHQDTPERPADVWEAQVLQNVFRLRNHPSLALWSGGNGFNPYSFGSTATTGVMERGLADFDPTRPFTRTSSDAGNVHVYPDIDPAWYGTVYRHVPFISETGIHSIPEPELLRKVIATEEFSDLGGMYTEAFAASHPDIIHHFAEYNPDRVPRMLSRASHVTDVRNPDLESLAEAAQVGAGEFYQVLSEEMQANYPRTAGLLPWVFKRPWPVFSGIMLVDGFGQPVAPYYFLKRTYEPTHVAVDFPWLLYAPGERMPIEAVVTHAGEADPRELRLSVRVLDDRWRTLWSGERGLEGIPAGPAVVRDSLGAFEIPASMRDRFLFVVAELQGPGGVLVSRSVYWPRALSRLLDPATRGALRKPPEPYQGETEPWPTLESGPWLLPTAERAPGTRLHLEVLSSGAAGPDRSRLVVRLRNEGRAPAFMTRLEIPGDDHLHYADDGYFWLAPGETRELAVEVASLEPGTPPPATIRASAWNAEAVTADSRSLATGGSR